MVPQGDVDKLFAWAQANDLALFPIRAWSKQPTGIVASHASDWSKELSRWREWYRSTGGCNFGVACGPSRLIVIDVDCGGEEKFAEWYHKCVPHLNFSADRSTVVTPTWGFHWYFNVPTGVDSDLLRQPNLCGKEVNVRAGHGYVVAPWSVTDQRYDTHVKASGPYILRGWMSIAPLALIEHCAPERDGAPKIVPDQNYEFSYEGWPIDLLGAREAQARANGILDRFEAAVPGERNEKLNQAAFDLGKLVAEGLLAEWRAVEMLQVSGEKIGIPRDEAKARSTIRSGLRAAPRVGRPEPRSAMMQLLAMAVPQVAEPIPLPPRQPPFRDDLVPMEPLVERLLYRGQVTILSGDSGSGKTTFLASLVAASTADVRDYTFGEFGAQQSDLLMYPCAWVFLSYEGGQHIRRTTQAWHVGTGCAARYPDRVEFVALDDGALVSAASRDVIVNEPQAKRITEAIDAMRAQWPGLPIALVVDNLTAAVENCMDIVQAQRFIRAVRVIARQDVAVVIPAHPPKSGSSAVYGSHLFRSLGDVVGEIEVVRRDDNEWVQWVSFSSKHREAPNGECLEVRSRRIDRPLIELPDSWGAGNARARHRQIRDLHVPYVSSIRVRKEFERESVARGVTLVSEVTQKDEREIRL